MHFLLPKGRMSTRRLCDSHSICCVCLSMNCRDSLVRQPTVSPTASSRRRPEMSKQLFERATLETGSCCRRHLTLAQGQGSGDMLNNIGKFGSGS